MLFVLVLSLCIIYLDIKLTKNNMGAPTNGIGAIQLILLGKSKAPMQYRVLIPWICGFLCGRKMFGVRSGKFPHLHVYLPLRWVAVTFAMFVSHLYFQTLPVNAHLCTTLLAVFFIVSSLYDYTDVYFEVGFLALAFLLFGSSWVYLWLGIITYVAGLNRETAIAIPAVAFAGGDWVLGGFLGFIFMLSYMTPRMIYGDKSRYCDLFPFGQNIRTIIKEYKSDRPIVYNEYTLFAVLLILISIGYVGTYLLRPLSPIEIVLGGVFLLLLAPTMWREIRVFAPTMLATIPMWSVLCVNG